MKNCASINIALLLCMFSLCRAQLSLRICGDDNADITCSFFFSKVDAAFRDETVFHTLWNSFFPARGAASDQFKIFSTIQVEYIPNITCKDLNYLFGERVVSRPPTISEVCSSNAYECGTREWKWEHQWSRTIIRYIIEVEDLHFLKATNFVAFTTSKFNTFDTSVFSEPERKNLAMYDTTNNETSTLASIGRTSINFFLRIDFLPCIPDDEILLDAWENILPWVCITMYYIIHYRKMRG